MLQISKLPEEQLKQRIRAKFESLNQKLSPSPAIGATSSSYQPSGNLQTSLGHLPLDFLKLAKIALERKKLQIYQFLIK